MDMVVKTDCLPHYDAAAFAYTNEITSMTKGGAATTGFAGGNKSES
jgi:hypothetical protein